MLELIIMTEYDELIAKLPLISINNNSLDDVKFNAIMSQIKNLKFYHGPESEGLNPAVKHKQYQLYKQAQACCKHDLKIEINKEYTADARKRVKRIIKCSKCNLVITDTIEEPITDEAIWR